MVYTDLWVMITVSLVLLKVLYVLIWKKSKGEIFFIITDVISIQNTENGALKKGTNEPRKRII